MLYDTTQVGVTRSRIGAVSNLLISDRHCVVKEAESTIEQIAVFIKEAVILASEAIPKSVEIDSFSARLSNNFLNCAESVARVHVVKDFSKQEVSLLLLSGESVAHFITIQLVLSQKTHENRGQFVHIVYGHGEVSHALFLQHLEDLNTRRWSS